MTSDAGSAGNEQICEPITVECTLLNGSLLLLHECVTVHDVRVKAAMHFGTHYPYICVVPLQYDTTAISGAYSDDARAPFYCHIVNTEATTAGPLGNDDIDWRAVAHSHAWYGDRCGVRRAAENAIRAERSKTHFTWGIAVRYRDKDCSSSEPFLTQVMCAHIERARAIGTSTTVANAVHCLLDCKANADCGPAMTLACVGGEPDVVALLLHFKAMSDLGDALKRSISEGHRDVVEVLMRHSPCRVDAYENAAESSGRLISKSTPIGDAITYGNRAIVDLLLSDPRCHVTVDHFFLAIRSGDKGIFDALLHHVAHLDDSGKSLRALVYAVDNNDHDTALITATQYGHTHLVEALVSDYSCPITQCNSERETPVMVAVQYARDDILAFLLTHDSAQDAVNIPSGKSLTPLIRAVYLHRTNMISQLIEHEADVNMTTSCGNTALHVAMTVESDVTTIQTLLMRGCAVNAPNEAGQTPLHLACGRRASRADETIVHVLVEFQAMVNICDAAGRTPLMRAVDSGNCASVRHLIASGACVDAGLLVAVRRGMEDVVKMLLEGRGDVNAVRDEMDGRTCLMMAAAAGRTAIVEDLLGARADVTAISKNGRNTAWWASRSGHSHIVEMLEHTGSVALSAVNDGASPQSRDRQSIGDDTGKAKGLTGDDTREVRESATKDVNASDINGKSVVNQNKQKSRSKKGKRK